MIAVFSQGSRLHKPPAYVASGTLRDSPESRERIDALLAGARRAGLHVVDAPPATVLEATAVHSLRYLRFLENLPERWSRIDGAAQLPIPNVHALGSSDLVTPAYPDSVVGQCGFHFGDGSAPVVDGTFAAALASAGTAMHGAKLVLEGHELVYALCRPPGHHASREVAAGFCYLNNTALAAETLTKAGRRVAVLDIDVHHGNGTESIFYSRSDVLTVSIHVDPRRFYPFFWGGAEALGRGEGLGFNLNIPLPRGSEDLRYIAALQVALARIREHDPDVMVLAAGLDASTDDPFKGFEITRRGFASIGEHIRALRIPILAVQEGGYVSGSLSENLTALLKGLMR